MRSRGLLLAVCVASCGCVSQAVRIAPDASVYGALIARHFPAGLPSIIIVTDTAIALPSPSGTSPDWLSEFEPVPQALRDAPEAHASHSMAARDASLFAKGIPLSQADVPRQARLVAIETIKSVFGGRNGLSTFEQTFGAQGWHLFSTVITTVDGRDALVRRSIVVAPVVKAPMCGSIGTHQLPPGSFSVESSVGLRD